MPPAIPDRWIPYKACGSVIEGTRLICFKVPLRKTVQTSNPEIKDVWDIPALLKAIPNLGAVIDLTNTYRYYNPQELLAAGILHKKILMPGRIIPSKKVVKEFMKTVDEFLGKDGDSLIGIHCTHGLNRTGYMVCRYMRDRLKVPAQDAITKFEKARGYQIERENYKADLLHIKPPPPDLGRKHTTIIPIDETYQGDDNEQVQQEEYSYNNGFDNRFENDVTFNSDASNFNGYNYTGKSRSRGRYGSCTFTAPYARSPLDEGQVGYRYNNGFGNGYNNRGANNNSNWFGNGYNNRGENNNNNRFGNGSNIRGANNTGSFNNRGYGGDWNNSGSQGTSYKKRNDSSSGNNWKDSSNWRDECNSRNKVSSWKNNDSRSNARDSSKNRDRNSYNH